ncbi:MAG: hypothetical protein AAF847_10940 [Bacteroidota bacterium]
MSNNILYTIFIILATCLFTSSLAAQNDQLLLLIDRSDAERLVLNYPSGTSYEVFDASDQVVAPIEKENGLFYEAGQYQIVIRPDYKESPDRLKVDAKQINILTIGDASSSFEIHQKVRSIVQDDYGRYNGKVKMDLMLVKSREQAERYNCIASFTNGIIFSYIDGKAAATLGEELLEIDGKYIIDSELGVLKLSFNPKDGQAWYVFEAAEDADVVSTEKS